MEVRGGDLDWDRSPSRGCGCRVALLRRRCLLPHAHWARRDEDCTHGGGAATTPGSGEIGASLRVRRTAKTPVPAIYAARDQRTRGPTHCSRLCRWLRRSARADAVAAQEHERRTACASSRLKWVGNEKRPEAGRGERQGAAASSIPPASPQPSQAFTVGASGKTPTLGRVSWAALDRLQPRRFSEVGLDA
jgi:hypothetical protein